MEEIWKTIGEYPNYQVSNMGRVKSMNYKQTGKEKILNNCKTKNGYLYVHLSKNGKVKKYYIHHLVASAFLDNPNNLHEVNHKDEDKTNNKVENLEYCDRSYNLNYGSRNERMAKSKSIPILHFTKNGEIVKVWNNAKEVERELKICSSDIYKCCKGKLKSTGGYVWKYNTIENYLIGVLNKSFVENGLKIRRSA